MEIVPRGRFALKLNKACYNSHSHAIDFYDSSTKQATIVSVASIECANEEGLYTYEIVLPGSVQGGSRIYRGWFQS